MQTNSKIFDDFAKLASGAMGTAQGMKSEIDNLVHQQLERMVAKMDLVPREEFDACKALIIKMNDVMDEQAAKIEELEAKLAKLSPAKRTRKAAAKPTKE